MRRLRSTTRIFFLASLALAALSCGASSPSKEPGSPQSPEEAAVEDSGKRMSGEFIVNSVEDAYRQDNSQAQTVFTFNDNGDFKRQDKSRIEEGSYLITAQNRMMLYIEKVNGDLRTAARVEQYQITDQSDKGFTLHEGPSRILVLRKR
jgi:hypothetical protein